MASYTRCLNPAWSLACSCRLASTLHSVGECTDMSHAVFSQNSSDVKRWKAASQIFLAAGT
jgi:hypothetical protein